MGTMADLVLKPWGAIFVGMAAGAVSTLGYAYVTVRYNFTRKSQLYSRKTMHCLRRYVTF